MNSLITTREATEYLRLNYMTVYKLAQRGNVPASKVGGTWRFRKDILDKWTANQTTRATATVLVIDDDPRVHQLLQDIIAAQSTQPREERS